MQGQTVLVRCHALPASFQGFALMVIGHVARCEIGGVPAAGMRLQQSICRIGRRIQVPPGWAMEQEGCSERGTGESVLGAGGEGKNRGNSRQGSQSVVIPREPFVTVFAAESKKFGQLSRDLTKRAGIFEAVRKEVPVIFSGWRPERMPYFGPQRALVTRKNGVGFPVYQAGFSNR